MGMDTATMETSMEVPQKIRDKITIRSSSSSSEYLHPKYKYIYLQKYIHPSVHCSIIYGVQDMKKTPKQ